ncbi:FAD:protein FMN transferase [Aurantimonas sp. A3-2-R12]|uniref:FAD:protein FMN transferase n=1 Tax=Aurantimonas sp. A3-2-R12 TaxID=3114362 RepID=UPI002E19404B|nr:FAD:protein FMN transferase [Aurantimonas sp. A3-2-R12]
MTSTRRRFLLGTASAAFCTALPARAAGVRSIGDPAFGSTWRVVMPEAIDPQPVRAAIEAIVTEVDRTMSPWRDGSDLVRFNRSRVTDWIPVSRSTSAVVEESLLVAKLSGGGFDPTVGPLVRRFGFGPIEGTAGRLADLRAQPGALRKAAPGMTLDLCGIAKGHALDRMATAITELGLEDVLIELGGEVRGLGRHPDGRPWQVGIERPGTGPGAIQRIVALDGQAMATSGREPNGYSDGRRALSHIIDPRTARPVQNGVATVSVLAPTAIRADALATALMVMGAGPGAALAERMGVAALFLVAAGDKLTEVMTDGFARHILA